MRTLATLLSVTFTWGCATPHVLVARAAPAPSVEAGVVFTNVHMFDGEQSLGVRDVLVRGGVIERVAAGAIDRAAAPDAQRIDGAGRTLLPASSTHTRTSSRTGSAFGARDSRTSTTSHRPTCTPA